MCHGISKTFPCYPMSHVVPVTEEGSCRWPGVVLITLNGAFQVGVNGIFKKIIYITNLVLLLHNSV